MFLLLNIISFRFCLWLKYIFVISLMNNVVDKTWHVRCKWTIQTSRLMTSIFYLMVYCTNDKGFYQHFCLFFSLVFSSKWKLQKKSINKRIFFCSRGWIICLKGDLGGGNWVIDDICHILFFFVEESTTKEFPRFWIYYVNIYGKIFQALCFFSPFFCFSEYCAFFLVGLENLLFKGVVLLLDYSSCLWRGYLLNFNNWVVQNYILEKGLYG